jgi:hypothetical protein
MKFLVILLLIVAAAQAVSFFNLVLEEWETFKVSTRFRRLLTRGKNLHLLATVIIITKLQRKWACSLIHVTMSHARDAHKHPNVVQAFHSFVCMNVNNEPYKYGDAT